MLSSYFPSLQLEWTNYIGSWELIPRLAKKDVFNQKNPLRTYTHPCIESMIHYIPPLYLIISKDLISPGLVLTLRFWIKSTRFGDSGSLRFSVTQSWPWELKNWFFWGWIFSKSHLLFLLHIIWWSACLSRVSINGWGGLCPLVFVLQCCQINQRLDPYILTWELINRNLDFNIISPQQSFTSLIKQYTFINILYW